jgi:hypothetical protein
MKRAKIGLLIVAIGWLILSMITIVWADELEKHYENEETNPKQTFEGIVADTFDFEEYAEWTAIRQKFEAKANKEKEQQLACIGKGGHPKQCVDPHWCLYPSNERKDECILYNLKTGF